MSVQKPYKVNPPPLSCSYYNTLLKQKTNFCGIWNSMKLYEVQDLSSQSSS